MSTPRSVAVNAALAAGKVLRGYYGRLESFEFKREIDLVTIADREAEEVVLGEIRAAFPDHAILAEESGRDRDWHEARARWYVDPLDGTTNFAHTYPHFSTSIGFEFDGRLEVGVLYVPLLDELFIGERGRGAWLNGAPIRVSTASRLMESQLSTGFQYDLDQRSQNLDAFARFTLATRAVRVDGSAAIDLCYVGCGRYDGYWEAGLESWDAAAGVLIVNEAGGRVTDYNGGDYSVDGPTCLATNGLIHEAMLDVLAAGEERGQSG
jgi:myo-inositol-1(or 4)-monophosphatase